MLRLPKKESNYEQLFLQRYECLRAWALKLVLGNQQQADDLLHDAFIHFTLHQSVIENIENLDAYLHTMLRNLHLSQARRLARTPQGHLSLLDYDSADIGLQSVDPRDRIKVQDELRMICRYTCMRKGSSKAGSVLILRFFHGYYPAEIARILRSPRAAVDNLLKTARNEAKLFQQNPEAVTFIKGDVGSDQAPGFGRIAADILSEMRETIFNSQRSECFSIDQLHELYESETTSALDAPTLAHLVSCARCLDETNNFLGLPLLATRLATESIGQDKRPKDDGGGGGGSTGGGSAATAFVKKSRRRIKQVVEHRPKELHISVNGFILGTQTISSKLSELTLNVNLDEKIAFVEVFSDRDVRLFFLNVQAPPEGPVEQPSRIELSEGRTLDVALNFSDAWPKLHALYFDPTLESVALESEAAQPITRNQASCEKKRNLVSLVTVVWSNLRRILIGEFLRRPATVTALFALLIVGALLALHLRAPTPSLPAAELLRRASANETVLATKSNFVIHRTLAMEERKVESAFSTAEEGALVASRRVEIWQSADRGLTTRRLFDEHNQLIAGYWRRSDGVQTLYHHGAPPRLQLKTALNFDNAWQLSLSAADFNSLLGNSGAARLEQRAGVFVIAYSGGSGNLLRATLILNAADLRPIEQTMLIRQNNELHEFHFTEIRFEEKIANEVSPTVFEPESELVVADTAKERSGDVRSLTAPLDLAVSASPVVASAALEVELLHLLNRAGADMGEQVGVTRTPDGRLRVEGIVDSDQRKNQILHALSPVATNPLVKIEISTVAEALRRSQRTSTTSGPTLVEGTGLSTSMIAADAELRRYFSAHGLTGSQLEDGISQFANQTLNRSLKIMQHAWALKRLAARFSQKELESLDPPARTQWLGLIRQHAQALAQQNETLRRELSSVFAEPAERAEAGEGASIKSDTELIRGVERLFEVCSANDRVVRQAFAITPEASRDSTIKSPQFWRSLHTAERIAEVIVRQ